jgi:malate synthase
VLNARTIEKRGALPSVVTSLVDSAGSERDSLIRRSPNPNRKSLMAARWPALLMQDFSVGGGLRIH